MSDSDSPLNDMQSQYQYDGSNEVCPDDSFAERSLPGFKLALEGRRSIRLYDGKPIPEDIMKDCLRDATLAPSSSNLQPYELYWVRDTNKKEAIAHACLGQPAATSAGELIVCVARRDLWESNLKKLVSIMTRGGKKELSPPLKKYYLGLLPKVLRNDSLGLNNFFRRLLFFFTGLKKPMLRTPINQGDHRIWAHIQTSLVSQTLMLSLAAHGYDSCPMGGMDEKRVKKALDLPAKAEVSMVISAGKRKDEGLYGPRVRLPEEDLIKVV